MRTRSILIGLGLSILGFSGISCVENSKSPEIQPAMDKVFPALARIFVVVAEPDSGRMERQMASGSGVIISQEGHVVTNHHVAGNATRIIVNLSNHEEIEATLVGSDPLSDISVLKLKTETRKDPSAPLPVAQWGDSDQVKVGDVVLAMGSPGAISQSVTQGIVSNPAMILPRGLSGRFILDGEDVGAIVRWIAHDAVIYGGNSGGPLVDLRGNVIGINEIGVASLGGAIPSNLARKIAQELIAHGEIERSWSGIVFETRLKDDSHKQGVLVAGVTSDSPAERAQLKPGDLLMVFNGQPLNARVPEDLPPIHQLIFATPFNKTVPIRYERDGKIVDATLTLEKRPKPLAKPVELKAWGVTARNITPSIVRQQRLDSSKGAIVDSLRANGPAKSGKNPLAPGDIITRVGDQEIDTVEKLVSVTDQLVKDQEKKIPALVQFKHGEQTFAGVFYIGSAKPDDPPAALVKPWSAMSTQVILSEMADLMKLPQTRGVRVTEVYPRQSAEKAGVKVGDLIVAVDGNKIDAYTPEHSGVFDNMIRRYAVGAEVELSVLREGESKKLKMTLEAAPNRLDTVKTHEDKDFEFTARDMVFEDRNRLRLPDDFAGVILVQVQRAGWASLGGLDANDIVMKIGDQSVKDVETLKTILAEAKKSKPRRLVFFVQRGILTFFTEIEPDWNNNPGE